MAATDDIETMAKSMSAHFKTMPQQTPTFEKDFVDFSRGMLRLIADPLVNDLGLNGNVTEPVTLLDSACGVGVVTQEVQAALPDEILQSSSFTCADSSEAMVDVVKKRIVEEKWVNVEAKVLDAQDTGLPESSFTHVAIALGLHIIPDPDAAVRDCMRLLKPGGRFGASTWPKSNANMFWIPDMREALQSLPFDAPMPDPLPMQMHKSGHWDDAAWIEGHLKELGLRNVSVKENLGTCKIENATQFIRCFAMMLPWVMNTFWSEEVRNAHPAEEVRELMRQYLEKKYKGEGWSIEWLVITMAGTVEK
ncbi:methyltransferase tpcH [Trichoderma asperellum]|uniref:Methyltransferase tpcH n=1 Tax=Trichoderma asperellum TaxID=101201 RepID=A0A6V8R4I3_TRIAP|nr:S-adenosyl-L-methionine-dependent methyltransferase [Trichoderma asperelloides]GFP57493.1 methyltransferase tpcH [Trichoderma asperellum]